MQEYAPKLIRWLTKELYSRQAFAINFLLSSVNNGVVEIIVPGNSPGDDGNWQIRISTAEDVTAGDSVAAGNLIVFHIPNGTKFEFEA